MKDFHWQALPMPLRHRLLAGGWGYGLLLDNARLALDAAQGRSAKPLSPETGRLLLDLARRLFLATWEAAPLDGGLAASLLEMHRREPLLAPEREGAPTVLAILATLAGSWKAPENTAYLRRLRDAREHERLARYLDDQAGREPDNLYWMQQRLDLACLLGDWPRVRELARSLPRELDAPGAKFLADAAFMEGDHEAAIAGYAAIEAVLPGVARLRGGEALARLGDATGAAELWRREALASPWRVNAALKLAALTEAPRHALAPPPGNLTVLLYTWNKAESLDKTLETLFASRLRGARVIVLDNGSSDGTAALLASWRERLGEDDQRLFVESLPLNIGAPAARNWLRRLPAARESDFIAYLDDDALVPEDWLEQFGQAVARDPGASVWGCRVRDAAPPPRVQNADLHLFARAPSGQSEPAFDIRLGLLDTCGQDLDFGQLSYSRPCPSVTGCCHLFPAKTFLDGPDFDPRYSPTQYDDLDRDLQVFARGGRAYYHGALAVGHLRASGALIRESRAGRAASYGNLVKLNGKYEPRDIEALEQADARLMEQDLLPRLRELELPG